METVTDLEARLGRTWRDKTLLIEALTHSSYGNEHKTRHNERLEFLGDSVLDLLAAEWLMANHPHQREGFMSQVRATIVCGGALAAVARSIGLPELLIVAQRGEYLREVESVLAGAVEALLGSVYLDSGDMNEARRMALDWGILK